MAYSPTYQIQQQRQLRTFRPSPFSSDLPVRPVAIADDTNTSQRSSDGPYCAESQLSSLSQPCYPEPVHSLSQTSTHSNSQPASLTGERSQRPTLTGVTDYVTVQERCDHRHSQDAGHAATCTRLEDQMPASRSSGVQLAGHTTYTYTCDESLDGDGSVEAGDHALWIFVSPSTREVWLSQRMS